MKNTSLEGTKAQKKNWSEKFEKKFVIPNGHFHDFYYKEHPYKRELWTNYIAEPGLDKLKHFISTLLFSQKKQIIKHLEEMRDERFIFVTGNGDWARMPPDEMKYYRALSEAIKYLKQL